MENNEFSQEMKLTYSGVFRSDGRVCSSVCFERGENVAEGIIPEGKITKNKGFSEEEVLQLENYLRDNSKQLMEEAHKISTLEHLLS